MGFCRTDMAGGIISEVMAGGIAPDAAQSSIA
jgi:hypothetical protein